MKKEDILELIPEISEDAAEKIIELHLNDVAELREEVDALSEKLESEEELKKEAYEKGIADAKEGFAKEEYERMLSGELEASGSKSTTALRALLKLDEISVEDGKLCGFSEQIEDIKKEYPFLFVEDEEKPKFTSGCSSLENGTDISKLSYKERLKLYRETPELYKQLVK